MRDVKVPDWLSGLPLAPEFRPTDTEFADPVAYISKIEKEASAFGICKVIPPLPKPSKKYVISNLNKSLSKCPELGSEVNISTPAFVGKLDNEDRRNDVGEVKAVFTTRQQELGQSGKRLKGIQKNQKQPPPIHKQVWQSGEIYTLEQFESKSKIFARNHLAMVKQVSPSIVEALFWEAASEKPIYVEYANDMPGSAFGEPERSPHYFRHTRRRRSFHQISPGGSESTKDQNRSNRNNEEYRGASSKSDRKCEVTTCAPKMSPDHASQSSRQKSSGTGNEMESTSGRKLSNSPWNLQVIARSPGSLTRFMPDDIPGVTSPMVYIGMLFSWFAWHVEDHELHSLNFLHTGSSKTWYAVPGDCAFTFEEVIRAQAYGGNIDRLAALTLLGEKTTLLSPEVIVASGIPCCRLVQNPGEFVVTFPRAYHVGFSHGFNCGEAANFGTPKWLTLAKEAAVRRAAMNHLPMLSHQQLLYLLTMSFISRVPRSLLPGVRSSRLKDRQKEERELLVKKAFIEDILNENSIVTCLLQKNSSYRAVLWDLESLPSSVKESDLCNSVTVTDVPRENVCIESNHELFNQSSCMEPMDYLYADDDDFSSDFQVDSGALPCVACGILGFPFMSVLQPSKEASMNILSANHNISEDQRVVTRGVIEVSLQDGIDNQDITINEGTVCERNATAITTVKSGGDNVTENFGQSSLDATSSSSNVADEVKTSRELLQHPNGACSTPDTRQSIFHTADDRSLVPEFSPTRDLPSSSGTKLGVDSNTYLRPRIFCLEHAIQVEKLLKSRGGANVLVICHSDFLKIKAHAPAVAEDIGVPFKYQEIPLDKASAEVLNFINHAIDDEGQDECEDWTSKVNINLRHCLKLGENFPSEKLLHALTLKGLSFDKAPGSIASSFEWKSRRLRSKRRKLNQSDDSKSSESTPDKKDEGLEKRIANHLGMSGEQVKLIQYSRRKFKSKHPGSAGATKTSGDSRKLLTSVSADPENRRNVIEIGLSKVEKTGIGAPVFGLLVSAEDLHQVNTRIVATKDCSESSVISQMADICTATPVIENVTSEGGDDMLKEIMVKDKVCGCTTSDSQIQHIIEVAVESSGKNDSYSESQDRSPEVGHLPTVSVQSAETVLVEGEKNLCSENVINDPKTTDDKGGQCSVLDDVNVLEKGIAGGPVAEVAHADITFLETFEEQTEKPVADQSCINGMAYDFEYLDCEVLCQINPINARNGNNPASANVTPLDEITPVSAEEIPGVPEEISAAKEMDSSEDCASQGKREFDRSNSKSQPGSVADNSRRRKREADLLAENGRAFDAFIRSPCEGLRPRASKSMVVDNSVTKKVDSLDDRKPAMKKTKDSLDGLNCCKSKTGGRKGSHICDLDGCQMSFQTKGELRMHKRNRCPHEGCGKKFSSHKNAVSHLRVHDDDRPLKCPWKGCTKAFKWAWARTEHVRVHTGERPYKCKVDGCELTFRFVSDYSRHRRKTGHYV